MEKIHLILFTLLQSKMFSFFTSETMLYSAFTVILNPRKELYLQSEIKKKHTWVKGFARGKKPRNHDPSQDPENSQCHKAEVSYHCSQSHDVGELIDRNLPDSNNNNNNRAYLTVVMNLAWQGIATHGRHRYHNFTHLLKIMGTKDSTITNKLQHTCQKFTHHDVQGF